MVGWIEGLVGGWGVVESAEGTQITALGQWSEEEEERGKWEKVISVIKFVA